MQIDIKEIEIPARVSAPKTCLRVRFVYKNQAALKTAPYVMILPGGPGANHAYYLDYDCLSEFVNLIYFDPRGCGLSDKGDQSTYNMNNYIHDIHVIKSSLQLESMVVLGKSYGAMCALGYSLQFPQDVSKLILAAGVPTHEFIQTAKANLLLRGTKEQQLICQDLWEGRIKNDEQMATYFKMMASLYSWKKRNQQQIERPESAYRFSFESLNEGFRTQFGRFDYTGQLAHIQCPTLILVGEKDWITDPKYSIAMAEKIPNSVLHIFKDADHAMESDVPDLFFSTIRTFLI